ncbi:hypothetical protein [Sulfurimonas paralvinellae]|uniref:PEGA domain-containing protein n=1 Tax=Sulfurimonas paralvinellae TaxID=317658 RepID=A0A7M1B929_9BACT|nr:hypothetical protein [Sulfurimonas paralvinellae]QOP46239.1 hypothetical protein FM071_08015 [Sulfurimonas paralvinellae]
MRLFTYLPALVLLVLILQGCMQEKPAPVVLTDTALKESNQTKESAKTSAHTLTQQYTLYVKAPQGARVRILNIKPKYHDNILLKPGKYLIEVTKQGYQKYKKWIVIQEDFVLPVTLHTIKNPYDTSYFKYVTKIEWKNQHDLFSLVYDKKSKLIWAMPSAYVDYILQKKPRMIVKDAVFAKGKPWPKIYETKLDTLIYSGYFRYRGRNFLFKSNNEVTEYKAGVKNQKGVVVAKLSKLKTNSMVNYWRLPKEKEFYTSNPFKKYQKYFQVHYSRYKDIHFNLPVLCTKLKKNRYNSNCSVAYAYNKKTGLYDGPIIKQNKHTDATEGIYFALNHAKNFALVMPVRAASTEYDKIIFNTKITGEQKVAALTTLLIKESLSKKRQNVRSIADAMASQAMHMVFGDPKVSRGKLYSSSNNFQKSIKASRRTDISSAVFTVKNGKFYLKTLR